MKIFINRKQNIAGWKMFLKFDSKPHGYRYLSIKCFLSNNVKFGKNKMKGFVCTAIYYQYISYSKSTIFRSKIKYC